MTSLRHSYHSFWCRFMEPRNWLPSECKELENLWSSWTMWEIGSIYGSNRSVTREQWRSSQWANWRRHNHAGYTNSSALQWPEGEPAFHLILEESSWVELLPGLYVARKSILEIGGCDSNWCLLLSFFEGREMHEMDIQRWSTYFFYRKYIQHSVCERCISITIFLYLTIHKYT